MARLPRSFSVVPNHSVHKTWRGHNKEWNLETNEQKQKYMDFLNEDLESPRYEAGSVLEAATLMSNHSHEMLGIKRQDLFSNHTRRHHSRYGAFFNKLKKRSGSVGEGRPHTTLIADDKYAMEVVFYIHANPLRARMVGDARDYYWSTHRLYAFGKRETWMRNIVFPKWYIALGQTDALRQKRYRELFALYLKARGLQKWNAFKRPFLGPTSWTRDKEKSVAEWRRLHRSDGPDD